MPRCPKGCRIVGCKILSVGDRTLSVVMSRLSVDDRTLSVVESSLFIGDLK